MVACCVIIISTWSILLYLFEYVMNSEWLHLSLHNGLVMYQCFWCCWCCWCCCCCCCCQCGKMVEHFAGLIVMSMLLSLLLIIIDLLVLSSNNEHGSLKVKAQVMDHRIFFHGCFWGGGHCGNGGGDGYRSSRRSQSRRSRLSCTNRWLKRNVRLANQGNG